MPSSSPTKREIEVVEVLAISERHEAQTTK